MQEAYRIYNIIEHDSLPKLAHMFELNEASIQNGEDLFTYTSLLEQKLDLVEERTVAQAEYLRRLAALTSLIGETNETHDHPSVCTADTDRTRCDEV